MRHYLLKPPNPQGLDNVVFDGPYDLLRELLRRKNVDLRTYDLGDIGSADKVIFFNFDKALLRRCRDLGLGPDRLVLLLFEPPAVLPGQYDPRVWREFGKVFTFRDDLVDGKWFFKLRYPQGQSLPPSLPTFEERKLATLINANKYSYVAGEGYSYRRKAIRFFDRHERFDLYGHGWNRPLRVLSREFAADIIVRQGAGLRALMDAVASLSRFRSYRGAIPDKYEILARYRFCLCFENQLDAPGYITEKLFDCFFCGAIPVYLGATNIEEYLPRDCFIDMREIDGFGELRELMESMPRERFLAIQRAGHNFITGGSFDIWTPEGALGEIVDHLV